MDPIIALFRALTNATRLHILRVTCQRPGITVSDLAREVNSSDAVVSKHLNVLVSLRLVNCTPSGRNVHVEPLAPRHQPALAGAVSGLLSSLWPDPQAANSTPSKVWNCLGVDPERTAGGWEHVVERVAFFLTAYTHLRRLLILRHLAERGATRQDALTESIGMSDAAASRQLAKLERRGIVERSKQGAGLCWCIAPQKSLPPFQRDLHRIVMSALRKPTGRG